MSYFISIFYLYVVVHYTLILNVSYYQFQVTLNQKVFCHHFCLQCHKLTRFGTYASPPGFRDAAIAANTTYFCPFARHRGFQQLVIACSALVSFLKIHVLYTNNMCYIQIFFVLFVTYKTIFPWIVIILL